MEAEALTLVGGPGAGRRVTVHAGERFVRVSWIEPMPASLAPVDPSQPVDMKVTDYERPDWPEPFRLFMRPKDWTDEEALRELVRGYTPPRPNPIMRR